MLWRILYSGRDNPARNMAIDEAIMDGVIKGSSLPTIRFYDWSPPTVSCGYNQIISRELDLAKVSEYGYGFVRRPTGGRLVLHEDEVTYSVIARCEGKLGGNVTESYFEISTALAAGFKLMGVHVELARGSLSSSQQRQDVNPCFASSSRFELNYHNKKIVGSAQVRRDGVLLQHGSILLQYDQKRLADLVPGLDDNKRGRLNSYLAKKTISINQILTKPISFSEATLSFAAGFQYTWNTDSFTVKYQLEKEEEILVKSYMYSKYLTDEWNKRK